VSVRLSLRAVVVVTLGSVVGAAAFVAFSQERNPRLSQIKTAGGTFLVAIADTPSSRSAGLSGRQELRGIDGLLLQWDEPGMHPIWMAGMRFPLDLVWIDRDGRVLDVLSNVPPCRIEPCPLYEPAETSESVAVLELPAGVATKRQVTRGTIVALPPPEQTSR
jgi:uncharacterized membrane protein (UPF0127 family)